MNKMLCEGYRWSSVVTPLFSSNPNGSGLPVWPKLTCANREYMQLVYGPRPGKKYQPKRMELWTETIPRLDTHRLPAYKGFPWTCPRATGLF